MRDLLATWGHVAVDLALPLALWTAVALVAEAGLRLGRAHAALSLPVRSALMAALPASLLAGPLAQRIASVGVAAPEALARVRQIVLPEIVVGAAAVPSDALGPPLGLVLLGALLLGAVAAGVVALVRLGVAYLRLVRLGWPEAPASVQALAAEALSSVRRPVRVVTGGEVPFTFGWHRPTIAVPTDLTGEALALALAHEAAHVRAGDALGHAAASVVAAVFAAHPLVHVLLRGQSLDRERLADAAVLSARPAARRAYGSLLVSFSDGATPRLALGAAPGPSPLLHRLSAMKTLLSPSSLRHARLWGRLAAGLTLTLVSAVGALASVGPIAEAQTPTRAAASTQPRAQTLTARGDTVLDFSQKQPELVGGVEALQGSLVYPESAKTEGIEGRVIVQFVVDAEGRPEQIEVKRRVDPRLDDAAVRAIQNSTFSPGKQDGRTVAVRMALPVTFRLPGSLDSVRAPIGRMAPAPAVDGVVYEFTEVQPEPVGGIEALQGRLVYPESAKQDGVEGRVILQFVVTPEGQAEQIKVMRHVDPRLDAAAIEAIRAQPFKPGQQAGQVVSVRMSLPVTFRLQPTAPEDQGARPVRGVVRYAGVDLSRLANGAEIQAMIDALPERLDAGRISHGDVRVEYLIDPDGTTSRFRVTSGPRDLHEAAVSVARALRTAENARPGAPTEGFFRLLYTAGESR